MTDQPDPDRDDIHTALDRLSLPGAAPIVVGPPTRMGATSG
jgi:hypothetical protein